MHFEIDLAENATQIWVSDVRVIHADQVQKQKLVEFLAANPEMWKMTGFDHYAEMASDEDLHTAQNWEYIGDRNVPAVSPSSLVYRYIGPVLNGWTEKPLQLAVDATIPREHLYFVILRD